MMFPISLPHLECKTIHMFTNNNKDLSGWRISNIMSGIYKNSPRQLMQRQARMAIDHKSHAGYHTLSITFTMCYGTTSMEKILH